MKYEWKKEYKPIYRELVEMGHMGIANRIYELIEKVENAGKSPKNSLISINSNEL